MSKLLVAIARPLSPRKAMERPGLMPPPSGNRSSLSFPDAPVATDDNEPLNEPIEDDPSPLVMEEEEPNNEDVGGAPFTQEQAGYCGPECRCQSCAHFMQPDSCKYVQGDIDPDGTCPLHSDRGSDDMIETGGMDETPEMAV